MATQLIESQDLSISKIFQDFYTVPSYQREYVWEEAEVEQLLSDIHTEFEDADGRDESEYFIGSIVVCPGTDGTLELIDGQQRITTTFLFLCAVRDHLAAIGESGTQSVDQAIAATSIDDNGNERFRHRLALQYDDSGDVLERIAHGGLDGEKSSNATRSIANIEAAYRLIRNFLVREFPDGAKEARRFYAYVVNRVKVIRIQAHSVARALKIFETVNDRGRGLDSMDLLKNLLFMSAGRGDFEKLNRCWKRLVDTLYLANEKPLRFLRYFILSGFGVEKLREDDIYDWFVRNEAECGYRENPIGFVDVLIDAAEAYSRFLEGRTIGGSENRYLLNMRSLGGSARQHLILLLAGRHLGEEEFSELCRHVENLFFVYILTRANTRDFERSFALWSKDLRATKTMTDLEHFVETRMLPVKRNLAGRFVLAFRSLGEGDLQKYRLRYVLGKLAQTLNEAAYGSVAPHDHLETFTTNQVDIEHILPQTPSEEALKEFGSAEAPQDLIGRLGNLTIIEKSLNAAISNRPYTEKQRIYKKSNFLLTQCIAEHVEIGVSTKVDRAVAEMSPFENWVEESIDNRQAQLLNLALKTWDMKGAVVSNDDDGDSSDAFPARDRVSSAVEKPSHTDAQSRPETRETNSSTSPGRGTSSQSRADTSGDGSLNRLPMKHLQRATEDIRKLYVKFRNAVLGLAPGVSERATTTYIGYHQSKMFAALEVQRHALVVWLQLRNRPYQLHDPQGKVESLGEDYKWSMKYRIKIHDLEELSYTLPLVELARGNVG